MNNDWEEILLNTAEEVFQMLQKMRLYPNFWIFRGVSRAYENKLISSIDRPPFNLGKGREFKIRLEQQSIEPFNSTYKLLANQEENKLMRIEITSLMLMQHYGAPTRLLDWSLSPYIAAYFAVCNDDCEHGQEGHDGKWFVCQFLYQFLFPRIVSQDGLFTFYSQFDVDHAEIIKDLLNDPQYYRRFRIRCKDKSKIRKILREKFNIWHGSIYPDPTGIAESVKEVLRDGIIDMK